MTNAELIKEFAQLLETKDRKRINKWKLENNYITDNGYATDCDTIECLIDTSDGVENYIKYLNDDPFSRDCKFINSKSKQKFIDDFK